MKERAARCTLATPRYHLSPSPLERAWRELDNLGQGGNSLILGAEPPDAGPKRQVVPWPGPARLPVPINTTHRGLGGGKYPTFRVMRNQVGLPRDLIGVDERLGASSYFNLEC